MKFMLSLIACSALVLGCSESPQSAPAINQTSTTGVISTDLDRLPMTSRDGLKIETVLSGVQVPWTFVWDHEGRMIFTERPGRVRVFENGKLREEPLLTLPDVAARSESGLMGMCLHPSYRENRLLYLAYSYRDNRDQFVKVVRYKNDGAKLTVEKTIIDKIPAAPNHAGTRVAFGPDGKLYVTTGDATEWRSAQKMDSINGKTLRLNDDGTIPRDNPLVGKPNTREEIWSCGHRNAQGLAWQPGTNKMFQTEHGPSGFEGLGGGACELNMVEAGKNYGWPEIYGTRTKAGMVAPLVEYTPASAPGSGMFYTSDKLPMFKNNFFFGALRPGILVRVVLDGSKVVKQERVIADLGRIREVAQGPDGFLYFSTSNRDGRGRPADSDDRIFRIVPE
jgi:glucose/arabinose dehydrogenase